MLEHDWLKDKNEEDSEDNIKLQDYLVKKGNIIYNQPNNYYLNTKNIFINVTRENKKDKEVKKAKSFDRHRDNSKSKITKAPSYYLNNLDQYEMDDDIKNSFFCDKKTIFPSNQPSLMTNNTSKSPSNYSNASQNLGIFKRYQKSKNSLTGNDNNNSLLNKEKNKKKLIESNYLKERDEFSSILYLK